VIRAPAVTLKHRNTDAPGVPVARLNVVEAGTVPTVAVAGTSSVVPSTPAVVEALQPQAVGLRTIPLS